MSCLDNECRISTGRLLIQLDKHETRSSMSLKIRILPFLTDKDHDVLDDKVKGGIVSYIGIRCVNQKMTQRKISCISRIVDRRRLLDCKTDAIQITI